jgi:hypothetical protein
MIKLFEEMLTGRKERKENIRLLYLKHNNPSRPSRLGGSKVYYFVEAGSS